jgi:folate-dependent phosphoribosylglycinamide formyltransferase PurN
VTSPAGSPPPRRPGITAGRQPFVEIVDRAAWNDIVLGLPRHSLHQGFEWGAVREHIGWRAHRYALMDGDRVLGAVALLSRSLPGVRRHVVYAPHGPVMDFKDRDAWIALRSLIDHLAGTLQPIFIRFSVNAFESEARAHEAFAANGGTRLPESWTVWNLPRIVMRSDITADEQILWRRVRRRYREYVAAAKRHEVVVSAAATIDEVRTVYDLLTQASTQRGYPVRSLGYYEALWRQYVANGTGVALVARRHGTVLGGLIAARFGDTAYLLHSARGPASVGGSINHGPTLCWQFIAWAKAQGCDTIDWGGSGTQYPAAQEDAGYGVYHFKRGFGASLEYMASYYDFVFEPRLYQVARRVERHVLPAAWDIAGRLTRWRRYTSPRSMAEKTAPVPDAGSPSQVTPAMRKLRILFLGNSHNDLSTSCLAAVARSGHDVTVVAIDDFVGSRLTVLQSVLKARGPMFVLRKVAERLRSQLELMLVRAGLRRQAVGSRAAIAATHRLPVIHGRNPNAPEFIARVRAARIDLIVVAGFNRILKGDLIRTPPLGCINVHPSLLPKYRGPDPCYWVLHNREAVSGVTVHVITEKIDAGDIIAQREFPIDAGESEQSLRAKATRVAGELLLDTLPALARGTAARIPQDEAGATYQSFRPVRGG